MAFSAEIASVIRVGECLDLAPEIEYRSIPMLEGARALSPLAAADIRQLLQGIFDDPTAPPDLAIEAFSVTAASLYGWCKPVEIERAMAMLTPILA